jgi:hypothetical protein
MASDLTMMNDKVWGGTALRLIGLLALVAGLVSVPALAQEAEGPAAAEETAGQEKGGFYAGVEVWIAEMGGLDFALADRYDVAGCDNADGDDFCGFHELQRSGWSSVGVDDLDAEASFSIEAGWRFPGGNRIGARYWTLDPSGESVSAESYASWTSPGGYEDMLGGLVPLLGSPTAVADEFGHLPYTMSGSVDTEATTFDVTWTREHDLTDAWEVEWTAGARWLSFDVEASATYRTDTPDASQENTDPALDTMMEERVAFTSETDGIGPIVGGQIGYRFGKRRAFRVHGSVAAAGIMANTEWTLRSDRTFHDYPFATSPDTPMNYSDEDSDRTVFTIEGEVGLSYEFKSFRVEGGLRVASWDDAWTSVGILDPADPTEERFRSDPVGVDFTGPYVGIRWGF